MFKGLFGIMTLPQCLSLTKIKYLQRMSAIIGETQIKSVRYNIKVEQFIFYWPIVRMLHRYPYRDYDAVWHSLCSSQDVP